MKKAVIIFAGPRKHSNTALLVEQAQRGLEEAGAETEIFRLNELNIRGCQACYYCKRDHPLECALKDDMAPILQALKEADALLLASPVYWGSITAQGKLWLDRLFPCIDINLTPLLPPGKKAAYIFTQNQPDPDFFAANLRGVETMLQHIGFQPTGDLIACDLDSGIKPMVSERPELLEAAYRLGKNLLG